MAEMSTNRLEAFSDGVIAIIVTIMVLELRAPSQPTLPALWKVAPVFLSYGLSFLVVAIMWVNHHHLIHAVRGVTARLLWTNIYLLFWIPLAYVSIYASFFIFALIPAMYFLPEKNLVAAADATIPSREKRREPR